MNVQLLPTVSIKAYNKLFGSKAEKQANASTYLYYTYSARMKVGAIKKFLSSTIKVNLPLTRLDRGFYIVQPGPLFQRPDVKQLVFVKMLSTCLEQEVTFKLRPGVKPESVKDLDVLAYLHYVDPVG